MLSAPHRLTLTGTPLENNLLELWAQVDFLLPGLLGSRNSFIERFVKDIEQNRSEEKTELLRSTIYPFILRRTKGSVAPELPDKEEITVYAEMEEKQAAFYHWLREHYRKKVDSEVDRSGIGKSSTTIFEALLRLRQAALFQEDPNVRLFLISLKAGGLGINLTAADYVILFDPWWNPAVERQAIDRVHRIGRSSKVIAYRYIVRETIEEKMLTLQARKRELAEEIITEERSLIKSLSREDLKYLFS